MARTSRPVDVTAFRWWLAGGKMRAAYKRIVDLAEDLRGALDVTSKDRDDQRARWSSERDMNIAAGKDLERIRAERDKQARLHAEAISEYEAHAKELATTIAERDRLFNARRDEGRRANEAETRRNEQEKRANAAEKRVRDQKVKLTTLCAQLNEAKAEVTEVRDGCQARVDELNDRVKDLKGKLTLTSHNLTEQRDRGDELEAMLSRADRRASDAEAEAGKAHKGMDALAAELIELRWTSPGAYFAALEARLSTPDLVAVGPSSSNLRYNLGDVESAIEAQS